MICLKCEILIIDTEMNTSKKAIEWMEWNGWMEWNAKRPNS